MRLLDRYDVICTGGGLSTYLTAALLSRAGQKVLVVVEPGYSRVMDAGGEPLDLDFSVVAGLDSGGAFGAILRDIGIDCDDLPGAGAVDAVTQILGPDFRIPIATDPESTAREIRREIPGRNGEHAAQFVSRMYQAPGEIPEFTSDALTLGQARAGQQAQWKKFWGKFYASVKSDKPRPLKTALRSAGAEPGERLAAASLGALTYTVPFNLGCEQVIRSLPVLLQSRYRIAESGEGLRDRLEAVITEGGGAVKHGTRVESLIAENGKVTGVLLSSYEGIVRAGVVVVGARLKPLYATLPGKMRNQALQRSIARAEPSHWRHTIAVTLKSGAIPTGATSSMVAIDSYHHPLEEENFIHIQILKRKNENTNVLLLTALVPLRASSIDYGYIRRLSGKMLRVLARVMPFSEGNIVSVSPDFRKSETPLKEIYDFGDGHWVPESMLQFYVRGGRWAQDFWGPPWSTPHGNLYLSGRTIWPSLGSYGEALVARKISNDILSGRAEGGRA